MHYIKNKTVKKLVQKYREILMLDEINSLLHWDLDVNLPEYAVSGRAEQCACLTKLTARLWQDKELRMLLDSVSDDEEKLCLEERAIVRNLKWSSKYYTKVPEKTIIDFSKTSASALKAWQKAKQENNFKIFSPHLEKIVVLNKEIAGYLGFDNNPYDALLDLYEPGLTASFCKGLFDELRPFLVAFLRKIKDSKHYGKENLMHCGSCDYPIEKQKQLSEFVLLRMGYDFKAGRMDVSQHAFTIMLGQNDTRITNTYKTNDFSRSLMVGMHEGGHALYDQGIKKEYSNTPLRTGASFGIHESQSRFWETHVGRSPEFLEFIFPFLQAFYKEKLSNEVLDTVPTVFNRVRAGVIRTAADEVTYNLHIMLRFEIESGLINGAIKVQDLPELWREKMNDYLGVVPETDSDGVLQDVHWSHGYMGYFPSYAMGNLYAAQFASKMEENLDLKELIRHGEFSPIFHWLRENIHQHGGIYLPDELVKKVTGEKLNPKFFMDYIVGKYSKIYGLS